MFKLQNYINYIDEKVIESLTMLLESESESSWCKMSVCIMTYNEERCIARCVKSIWDLADEIIIVDTGSSDNTLNILKEFKEKVKIYTGEWRQDFSEIRNKLIEKATCPLIFQLDADEYLESKNDCIILKKIASTIYDNLPCPFSISPIIKNSNGHKQYRTRRIFPNISKLRYFGEVHEELRLDENKIPPSIEIDIVLQHDGYEKDIMKIKNKVERNTRLLKRALDKNPESVRWNYFMGRDLSFKEGAAKEALGYLKNALELIEACKENIEYEEGIYVLMGQIFVKLRDYGNLVKIVEILKGKYKKNIDYIYFELELIKFSIAKEFDKINDILKQLNELTGFESFIHSEGEHIKRLLIMLEYCGGNYRRTSSLCQEAKKTNINLDDIYACFREKYIEQKKYLFSEYEE